MKVTKTTLVIGAATVAGVLGIGGAAWGAADFELPHVGQVQLPEQAKAVLPDGPVPAKPTVGAEDEATEGEDDQPGDETAPTHPRATPAIPATPAVPPAPGEGGPATRAIPATPAVPAQPHQGGDSEDDSGDEVGDTEE